MSVQITSAEINAALALFRSASFADAIAAMGTAAANPADIGDDAVFVEDVLSALSAVPGLAVLGDVSAAIKLLMIIGALAVQPPNGGVLGAFADSLAGVVRPVADPDGSGDA